MLQGRQGPPRRRLVLALAVSRRTQHYRALHKSRVHVEGCLKKLDVTISVLRYFLQETQLVHLFALLAFGSIFFLFSYRLWFFLFFFLFWYLWFCWLCGLVVHLFEALHLCLLHVVDHVLVLGCALSSKLLLLFGIHDRHLELLADVLFFALEHGLQYAVSLDTSLLGKELHLLLAIP